ncbi:glycosyltransferase family 9 protein [Cellulomonas sp. 73-145]|uniref:glycosyltransferase family 9 protein n=1 Tax=Cellulomonas sp. 73-145 TaxID=1895739 RepID=UPI00344BD233
MTQARPQLTGAAAPASHLIESRAGTLTIPALADVVAHAAVLTCGDTGVAHLATALGTPSVLLFGPTPPQLGPGHRRGHPHSPWARRPNSPGRPPRQRN